MSTLKLNLEPFEIDSGNDKCLDKQTGCGSEDNSELDLDELEAELDDLVWEEEVRRPQRLSNRPAGRRPRSGRPLRPSIRRPRRPRSRPTKRPKRPIIRRPRPQRPVVSREPAAPCVCPAHGTEFIRWVQNSLNQILRLRLPVNGVMNRATRDALRNFQKQEGLPVDGIAGPETEKALVDAKAGRSGGARDISGEFEELELDLADFELEEEVNRTSQEYVRWVQQSLNKILGVNLKVDGIPGTQTRNAIRTFQKRFSLAVDGIVGPQTEAMLVMLGLTPPPSTPTVSTPGTTTWVLPSDVRAAGEAQHVRYDSPPAWAGNPGNCAGTFTPGAQELRQYILDTFPGVSTIGGYACRANTGNPSETSVHGVGRALDIMIPPVSGRANSAVGDPIANWLVRNAEQIGVQYIIWNRVRWSGHRTGRKDGRYGGDNPHIDHIHVELNRDGAARRTPWF